ncbi:hypothetical protein [Elioraea rosea]|uniref:hypothetical protein n=1 Tax=Elioraea rosea TaxID=2492390 RepID=UPI001183051F|nr:hypothetical protein [Elioraea rosea]
MDQAQLRQTRELDTHDLNSRLAAMEIVIEAILPVMCERNQICGARLRHIVRDMRERRSSLEARLDETGRDLADQMLARVELYLAKLPPPPEP